MSMYPLALYLMYSVPSSDWYCYQWCLEASTPMCNYSIGLSAAWEIQSVIHKVSLYLRNAMLKFSSIFITHYMYLSNVILWNGIMCSVGQLVALVNSMTSHIYMYIYHSLIDISFLRHTQNVQSSVCVCACVCIPKHDHHSNYGLV